MTRGRPKRFRLCNSDSKQACQILVNRGKITGALLVIFQQHVEMVNTTSLMWPAMLLLLTDG